MATHCLHVGINDYRGAGHDLAGCLPDVRNDERLFNRERRHRGTRRDAIDECRYFGNCETQNILTDRQATRAKVLAALELTMKRLVAGDWAIVTFSGHGTYALDRSPVDESDGFDEALVCHDLAVIRDDELAAAIEKRKPNTKVLLITDSCHSGTAHRHLGERIIGWHGDGRTKYRFVPPSRLPTESVRRLAKAIRRDRKLVDVIHLGACLDHQLAADAPFGGGHEGALHHFYLRAVCELPARATFGDWFARLADYLPGGEFDQQPVVNSYARCLDWKLPSGK
jgi:hypothetical protein